MVVWLNDKEGWFVDLCGAGFHIFLKGFSNAETNLQCEFSGVRVLICVSRLGLSLV